MRASAFVFSLLAAAFGFGVLVLYLQFEVLAPGTAPAGIAPLIDALGNGPAAQVALGLCFVLPLVSIVGGGITLHFVWPGVLLTLVAAVGWVFLGLLLGRGLGIDVLNITPLVLSGLAAIFAFLGGFESERAASWIAGLVAVATAGLLGFLIFDYYRGADSMLFSGEGVLLPAADVPDEAPDEEDEPAEERVPLRPIVPRN